MIFVATDKGVHIAYELSLGALYLGPSIALSFRDCGLALSLLE